MVNSGDSIKRKLGDSEDSDDFTASLKRPKPESSEKHSDQRENNNEEKYLDSDISLSGQNYYVKRHKPESSEKQLDEGKNDNEEEIDNEENQYAFALANDYVQKNRANPKVKLHEQLFDGEEKNAFKEFRINMMFSPSPDHYTEDPSSPFAGQDDEVHEYFNRFLFDLPDEENVVRYLSLRQEANEITVALSMEEILQLKSSTPFMATAQHIDAYLYCHLKLFPNEIQQRINVCSAYMISLNIKDLNEWTDVQAPLSILEKALKNEMKEVDVNIIPLLYGEHWTLAIVCGLGQQREAHIPGVPFRLPCVLHFNSLPSFGITNSHAYAITKAVAEKAHIDPNNVEWYEIECPKQSNDQDCGFYIMRFAVDFLKNISSSPHCLPVQDLFYMLQFSSRYNNFDEEEEENTVAKKAIQQLKGFIASIRPEDRNWMDEFSEGRPCTIDIYPYCIPEKIIRPDGADYKVKMLNWKIQPSVPFEYVMKHWKHIYDDYIASQHNDY